MWSACVSARGDCFHGTEVAKKKTTHFLLSSEWAPPHSTTLYGSLAYLSLSLASSCTANEVPVRIQYKCLVPIYGFPEMKLYFQIRIIMFCLPVPTLIYLWEIYIFPGSVSLFCCRKIFGPILGIYKSLTDWGRAIPRKGIHIWDFRCSVCRICVEALSKFASQRVRVKGGTISNDSKKTLSSLTLIGPCVCMSVDPGIWRIVQNAKEANSAIMPRFIPVHGGLHSEGFSQHHRF